MRRGWLQASLAVSTSLLAAQLEAGYRFTPTTSGFAFGRLQTDGRDVTGVAGVGVRF